MKFLSNVKDWFSWRLINQIVPRLLDWFQTRTPEVYAGLILFGTSLIAIGGALAVQLNEACEAGILCNTSLEAWLAYILVAVGLVIDILAGKRPASDIKDLPKPPQKPKE
jgi:hypothetical protein